jgi:hypothetical protein
VPYVGSEDSPLGSWVNYQRISKRKLDRGEPSGGMTAERVATLTANGFVWDKYKHEQEEQLARLAAYKAAHGDCNVPRDWAEDPRLADWVDMQRRFKPGRKRWGLQGAHLNPLGLFSRASIPFIWRMLSAFLPA